MSVAKIPSLIKSIYSTVAELERLFPHRKFTPDGILVGSIGEVLAAHHYGLELLSQNSANHDARDPAGRLVQIKTTQRSSIDIRTKPDNLLVLKLHQNGTCDEFYNGRGSRVWAELTKRPLPKVGFYSISLAKLTAIEKLVPQRERFKRIRP
jgi:hypothetical protein